MQSIEQALEDVRQLHQQWTHQPAPEIGPQAFLPIPPGYDPVAFAIEEVARLKQWMPESSPQWMPKAGVYTAETGLMFVIEIPGVAKEDVRVSIVGNELVVEGTRKPPVEDDTFQPAVVEQAWGAFHRRFPVPPWCAADTVSARYALGLLYINFAKKEDGPSTQIQVEIG